LAVHADNHADAPHAPHGALAAYPALQRTRRPRTGRPRQQPSPATTPKRYGGWCSRPGCGYPAWPCATSSTTSRSSTPASRPSPTASTCCGNTATPSAARSANSPSPRRHRTQDRHVRRPCRRTRTQSNIHPLLRWTIFGRNVPLGETSTTTYATDPCPGGKTCPSGRRPRAGYLPTPPGWLEIRSSRAQPATSPQTAPGPPRTQELPRRTAAHPPNGSSLALCNPTRTADRSWAEPAWCAAVASVWAARRLFARAARLITRASVRRPVPVLTTRAPDLLAGATDYMPSLHLRLAQASQVSEDITSHMVAAASNLTEGRRALSHIRPGRAAPAHRARGTSQTSQSHIPSRGSRRRSPATSPVGHHTRAQRSAEDRHRSTSARLCPGQRPDRSPLSLDPPRKYSRVVEEGLSRCRRGGMEKPPVCPALPRVSLVVPFGGWVVRSLLGLVAGRPR